MLSQPTLSHESITKLTNEYISAFTSKDIKAVADLLTDEFSLTDPALHAPGPIQLIQVKKSPLLRSRESLIRQRNSISAQRTFSLLSMVMCPLLSLSSN